MERSIVPHRLGALALWAASLLSIGMAGSGALPALTSSITEGLGAGLLALAVTSSFAPFPSGPIGSVGVLPGVSRADELRGVSKSAEKRSYLSSLGRAIDVLQSSDDPEARLNAIYEARFALYRLSPELRRWSGEVRLRVFVLLKAVARDLDNLRDAPACLDVITLVLHTGGESAGEMVKSVLGDKVEQAARSGMFNLEPSMSKLLLTLHEYSYDMAQKSRADSILSCSRTLFALGAPADRRVEVAAPPP